MLRFALLAMAPPRCAASLALNVLYVPHKERKGDRATRCGGDRAVTGRPAHVSNLDHLGGVGCVRGIHGTISMGTHKGIGRYSLSRYTYNFKRTAHIHHHDETKRRSRWHEALLDRFCRSISHNRNECLLSLPSFSPPRVYLSVSSEAFYVAIMTTDEHRA
eukprot:scaffold58491_cov25-Prasinocladus_malaysianus.AAC.1